MPPIPALRCALVILPAKGGDPDRVARSVEAARATGLGDLAEIEAIEAPAVGLVETLARAGEAAASARFDWLLAVSADEAVTADIFVKTAPALRLHDAVWGAASLAHAPTKVDRATRLAAQDLPSFFHAALRWWIGPSHLVRPALAAKAGHAAAKTGRYADYMHFLWTNCRAYKTAQALTLFREAVPPLAEADRERLVAILEREPAFMAVRFGPATFRLPYTGLNPVIEREQMRGLFFESEELEYLAGRLPRGLSIVDVGANTGNHTVFFAGAMQARTVVPVEPLPRAAAAIRAAVLENRLENVDLSSLGKAVGAGDGRLRPVPSVTAGLGATHFVPDAEGEIVQMKLDSLVREPVDFVKIDVEGMELQALCGASGLIAACRPMLYVEVLDSGIAEFMAWVDGNEYRVERLFPDKTHCNYFLVPQGRT